MDKRHRMILYRKNSRPIIDKKRKRDKFNRPVILSSSVEGGTNYSLYQLNTKHMLLSLKKNLARMKINLDLANVYIRSNSGTVYKGPLKKYNPDQSIDSCVIKNIPKKSYKYPVAEIEIKLSADNYKTNYVVGFRGISENEGLVGRVVDSLKYRLRGSQIKS